MFMTLSEHLGEAILDAMLSTTVQNFAYCIGIPTVVPLNPRDYDIRHEDVLYFFEYLYQCSFALLSNGELATVSGSVQISDVVSVLSGAFSPCALRSELNGAWKVICGDCELFNRSFDDEYGITFTPDIYLVQYQGELEEFRIH
ncbi:hypothetical protein BU23DRAFT_45372 [Bimuria novae-zelandiae CBS 107.79]|uniref:Uncharacterized protein n=1 Tax=Bimuria novae-zelandiae CBS 107.79 TaxID=1447943 RepID=A0A6A5VKR2_9PLEO|nr:hypothetical protein BU23DRAFT_45372 [Bimuria novae-zelandiae CBS 107.79]